VDGFGEDEMSSGGRGQLLMPWPNRIRDGRYSFEGKDVQLPLTEPARGHASHGRARWAPWALLERPEARVTVGHGVRPQACRHMVRVEDRHPGGLRGA